MIFNEDSPLAAWKTVSYYLIGNRGEAYNLQISFPCSEARDETPLLKFDPRHILGGKFDCARDVANTIFPLKTWSNSQTRDDFYNRYKRAHERNSKPSWGTYFERLIAFGGTKINQLERVIYALNNWENNHKAALLMHTSSPETDNLRTLGGPCLQYVQFNCPKTNQIDLMAVYRNHDYCNKVLGNFFGLSRLLRFVGEESGRCPGMISCLSIHAYISTSLKRQKELIESA